MNLSLVYLLFLIIISRQMYLCLPFTSTKNPTYTIVSRTSLMRNAASALTKNKNWGGEGGGLVGRAAGGTI